MLKKHFRLVFCFVNKLFDRRTIEIGLAAPLSRLRRQLSLGRAAQFRVSRFEKGDSKYS